MANLPNLKHVGADLDITGVKDQEFPTLEYIGRNFILIQSGMPILPPNLKHIGGDVIISNEEPTSLIDCIKKAKVDGVIKGNIFILLTNFE